MELETEGRVYELVEDPGDKYVASGGVVAYSDELAEDFKPVVLDHKEYGSKPVSPEFMAYRIVVDPERRSLCIVYEIYWRRQDCGIEGLNKDHEHDYEQLQVHFDMEAGRLDKVAVSSVGPTECAGHGVEVYSRVDNATSRMVHFVTSPKEQFPWGGGEGRKWFTQVREMPLEKLVFSGTRPVVKMIACYHVFAGLKVGRPRGEEGELEIALRRLDSALMDRWYLRHANNRFGHDLTKPQEEPHMMYYPPPENWVSRLVYSILWAANEMRRKLGF